MDTLKICKQCRKPVPETAPEGLCPECLAKVALGSEPAAPGARVPPEPADLAQQFPQLEIIELLGMGGMGMVYKARQPRLDRFVALKILPVDSAHGASFAERFEREARALAKLNHPGIVTLHDFGQTKEYYYFIMEYVDGMNLRQLIQAKTLEPRQALELVTQICTALQFAHDEKIVHRDIKPENILITKKGQVKIADFGLAKLMGGQPDTALTASQMVMGTLNYMAPEQREKPLEVDHRADIYSLGVVFYEMLTGEVPMGRFDAPSKKVQIDVRLDEVVLHALEREPARRYQQVSEVKSNVETITSSMPREKKAPVAPEATQRKLPPSSVSYMLKFLKRLAIFAVVWLGAGVCLRWATGNAWLAVEPHGDLPTPFLTGLLRFAFWLFNPGYAWFLLPQAFLFILGTPVKAIGKFGLTRRQLPPLIRRQLELRLIVIGGVYVAVALVTIFLFWFNYFPFSAQNREQLLMILLATEILFYQNLVLRANNRFYYAATKEINARRWTPPQAAPPFPTAIKVLCGLLVLSLAYSVLAGFSGARNLDAARLMVNLCSMLIVNLSLAMILIFALRLHSRQRIQQAREKGLWPPLGEVPTLEHVKGLAGAGEKILAIKLYRQIHPVSLLDAKAAVEKLVGDSPPSETFKPQPRPRFASYVWKTSTMLVLAYLVGAFIGLAPDWSYTTRYWGVVVTQDASAPVQVLKVASDSPAERTGFMVDDVIKEPASFASFSQSWDKVKQGDKQTFTVRRSGKDVMIEASAAPNQLAAVWYANLWYPIAGALFICVGIIAFATASVAPPPLWRSISVAIAGVGIAIGFAVAVTGDSVFPRFAVYERWIFVPTRNEWCGLQGLIGMAAAVLVTILGAVEIRQRLTRPPAALASPAALAPAQATFVSSQPRLSKTALAGAVWAFGFLLFALMSLFIAEFSPFPDGTRTRTASNVVQLLVFRWGTATSPLTPWLDKLWEFTLISVGLTAPFGTTILGYQALSKIRYSAGRVYGLGLALFDALFFPLLIVNSPVLFFFIIFIRKLRWGGPFGLLILLVLLALINYAVVRQVWRLCRRKRDS